MKVFDRELVVSQPTLNTIAEMDQINLLWEQLREARQDSIQFEQELELAWQIYQSQILPRERELLLEPSSLLVARLMKFLDDPQLTSTQYSALISWVRTLIDNIHRLDATLAQELDQELYLIATQLFDEQGDTGISAGQLATLKRDQQQDHNQANESWLEAPKGFYSGLDQVHNEAEDWSTATAKPADEQVAIQALPQITQMAWFKSLFRREAQQLHPDRETDPAERAIKANLMQQLLDARREEDFQTLFDFYLEYVEHIEIKDPALQQEHLVQVLQAQLSQTQWANRDILHRSPERALAYDMVFSFDQQERTKKVAQAHAYFVELKQDMLDARAGLLDRHSLVQVLAGLE